MKALPHPAVISEMGGLKTRLEIADGADVSANLTPQERAQRATPRTDAPTFVGMQKGHSPAAPPKSAAVAPAPTPPAQAKGKDVQAIYYY